MAAGFICQAVRAICHPLADSRSVSSGESLRYPQGSREMSIARGWPLRSALTTSLTKLWHTKMAATGSLSGARSIEDTCACKCLRFLSRVLALYRRLRQGSADDLPI